MKIDFELFKLSEEKEKRLWKESVIIFDSSALLDIYFLPKRTREKVFDNLFAKKLNGRLWIPSHVSFEYDKNRESIIKKPIIENYKPLKDELLKSIKTSIKTVENNLIDLKNQTKKDDKYPHLQQTDIDSFSSILETFKKDSESFETAIFKQIAEIETEIKELANQDDVLDAIEKYFSVGRDYSFDEILAITKEGKHRYEFSIPPGYEDLKDKKGTQIFGDLIIWKQIIEYASEIKKPILLICNDVKEDWCYKEDGYEKRIKSPREELIKEIFGVAKVEFWMYNLPQFLYKSNEYIAETPEETIDTNKILNFSQFLNERNFKKGKDRNRVINDDFTKCEECDGRDGFGNHISSWGKTNIINEYPDTHTNSKYQSAYIGHCEWCNTLHIECPKCHSVTGILDFDYDEKVECVGGCGITFFVESDNSYDNYGEYEIKIIDHRIVECNGCGEDFIDVNKIGICDECEGKYVED
ncbi:MAG: PIN domain-containing protein [Prolixibacteraceae bacterium]|nr:PIN domain-containing protein [Prolixibacteraceae bacterium]